MVESATLLATLSSAVGTLLALAAEIGLLVIALAMVRPRRPDAAMMFAIAAAVNILCTLLWPVFTTFVTPLLRGGSGSASSIGATYAVFGLFMTLLRTVGWALLLFGIVKLVSPPPGAPRDPTRYG